MSAHALRHSRSAQVNLRRFLAGCALLHEALFPRCKAFRRIRRKTMTTRRKNDNMTKVGRTMFDAGGQRGTFDLTFDELQAVIKAVAGSMDLYTRYVALKPETRGMAGAQTRKRKQLGLLTDAYCKLLGQKVMHKDRKPTR